jgi:hypothetical protein
MVVITPTLLPSPFPSLPFPPILSSLPSFFSHLLLLSFCYFSQSRCARPARPICTVRGATAAHSSSPFFLFLPPLSLPPSLPPPLFSFLFEKKREMSSRYSVLAHPRCALLLPPSYTCIFSFCKTKRQPPTARRSTPPSTTRNAQNADCQKRNFRINFP